MSLSEKVYEALAGVDIKLRREPEGKEYTYTRWSADLDPVPTGLRPSNEMEEGASWTNSSPNFNVTWTPKAPKLNSEFQYLYRAVRNKTGDDTDWEVPEVVKVYGDDGPRFGAVNEGEELPALVFNEVSPEFLEQAIGAVTLPNIDIEYTSDDAEEFRKVNARIKDALDNFSILGIDHDTVRDDTGRVYYTVVYSVGD